MKIDLGSGGFKRDGHVGIDVLPEADIRCDIERERWPIDDNSVTAVFSSHCFEHVRQENLTHIFREISRVCADGAKLEIWHPYAFHRDAHVIGHINPLTEEVYYHLCVEFQDAWTDLGARWYLDEVRYHVDVNVQRGLADAGIAIDFAIRHLNNVVNELGVFITLDKTGIVRDRYAFRRTLIDHQPGTPIRETRDWNARPI